MDALILVDLQYDFMPGGSLAVPKALREALGVKAGDRVSVSPLP